MTVQGAARGRLPALGPQPRGEGRPLRGPGRASAHREALASLQQGAVAGVTRLGSGPRPGQPGGPPRHSPHPWLPGALLGPTLPDVLAPPHPRLEPPRPRRASQQAEATRHAPRASWLGGLSGPGSADHPHLPPVGTQSGLVGPVGLGGPGRSSPESRCWWARGSWQRLPERAAPGRDRSHHRARRDAWPW